MAKAAAYEDWNKDNASGSNMMTKDAFLDSLFEVVDIWTESVDKEEYVSFLRKLLLRITKREVQADGTEAYVYRELKDIDSLHVSHYSLLC